MKFNSSKFLKYTIIFTACFTLSACLSTDEPEQNDVDKTSRATFADLTGKESRVKLDKISMSKTARAAKLAEIYESILTLEPDPEVRTRVEYRLVQINTEAFENTEFNEAAVENKTLLDEHLAREEQALATLVNDYRDLLTRFPDRTDNEFIQYQLAKALDLQGKLDESLLEMERLLARYPQTKYLAELNFRRGEIYYNLQDYPAALSAYQLVMSADNNSLYLINSIYMSGWALFKLNRLPEADSKFIQVFETMIAQEKRQPTEDLFSFEKLNSSYVNLALDTQRVLSISLSQQEQAKSLVALVKKQKNSKQLYLYQHLLFKHLADFLVKKDLKHDAQLTYHAYIELEKDSIWAARFTLELLTMYHQQGKFSSMHSLKVNYVNHYGLNTTFWQQASTAQQEELLPHLLEFSYEKSRRLYADAQEHPEGQLRVDGFKETALWLKTYLSHAKLPKAEALLTHNLLEDKYLYADASFEAQDYLQALASYESIAYGNIYSASPVSGDVFSGINVSGDIVPGKELSGTIKTTDIPKTPNTDSSNKIAELQVEAAYATTLTIRKILLNNGQEKSSNSYNELLADRNRLDKLFIEQYPNDNRTLSLATQATEYSFSANDYKEVNYYSDFILSHYHADNKSIEQRKTLPVLSPTALKQVQIVSQLQANSLYQQALYKEAEISYTLALRYVKKQDKQWAEMRNLVASCIYFQAEENKEQQPKLAVHHYLRVGKVIPESTYRVTAEFDAANLLLAQFLWQQAIDVMLPFQKRYPTHEFSASIPAKLAKSYEGLERWDLAADQLLLMNREETSEELKREAQYTAAEYYLKAGDRDKALTTFRTYAHTYPEPFDIAQEVRFKMSEFYRESKEPNKRYFWYRKILSFHTKQVKNSPNSSMQRSTYLSSTAALGLGQAHQQSFKWIKLKSPLNKSLKRKQKAMKEAIRYYQKVLDFKQADFVPNATFNLAEMYRQLAADVMSSQRPKELDELALEEYEILLEEIAYPFEEKAIEIHVSNIERAWQDVYDEWISKSFTTLAELAPALYNKQEREHVAITAIH